MEQHQIKNALPLISEDEQKLRLNRLAIEMSAREIEYALIADNASLFWLCGRVFAGVAFVRGGRNPEVFYFVRRPVGLEGKNVLQIRKPEDIPTLLEKANFKIDERSAIGLQRDATSWSHCERLSKLFPENPKHNIDPALKAARAVKTPCEIALIAESGRKQTAVYNKIPSLWRPGMTDLEFQIAIEGALRLEGCLGQFRVSGTSMEIFMGNVLSGDNADTPTPYDFAMGGGGHPSLPVGADGSKILSGQTVMVDCNGNFTGYMTDMTRTFRYGEISELALKAHECSRRICSELANMACPEIEAKKLYERAIEIVEEANLKEYFMGHRQQAGFVGHGVGIEINELPVIAPRSRDIIEPGNVIALEPKFVIPGTGAVGIENTYVVLPEGSMKCLTNAPEEIIALND